MTDRADLFAVLEAEVERLREAERTAWERGRDAALARILRTAKGYERVDDNMSGSAMRILAYHVERLTPEASHD